MRQMHSLMLLSAWSLLLPVVAAEPQEPPRCLQPERIRQTTIPDDQTILFHMIDGSVWMNRLQESCPGLKIEGGFAYEVRGGEICANLQTIRVLRNGAYCQLGQFLPPPPPKEADKP